MIVTHHARERWQERCPERDMQREWLGSKPLKPKQKRAGANQCGAHVDYMERFAGRYYRMTADGQFVFVATPPEVIITIIPVAEPGKGAQ